MTNFIQQHPLILASGSVIRSQLLKSLGLEFSVVPSHCDEEQIKAQFMSDDWSLLGMELAIAKAKAVSQTYPEHYIIAADQLCVIDQCLLDKPLNHPTAVKHLKMLSGKTHQQIACVVIAKASEILWQYEETALLTMYALSDETIETYLQKEKPYHSCGAFQYETQGKLLFDKVEGHTETILGLPLAPLIQALKRHGIIWY